MQQEEATTTMDVVTRTKPAGLSGKDRLHSDAVPRWDKDAKRWLMSLVGLFHPVKKLPGRNGKRAMERRRKQIAKGILRATR